MKRSVIAGLAALLSSTPALVEGKPAQHVAVTINGYDSLFLSTNFSHIEDSLRAANYRVEEIDASALTENDLLAKIRGVNNQQGPVDVLYFGVHGYPHVMNLSARERITPEEHVIDEFDFDFFTALKGILAPDATIILESCYTGHGAMNVATMMAYGTQRTVYAPNRALFLLDKDLNPTSRFEFDAQTGKPTTMQVYGLVTDIGPQISAKQRFYPHGTLIGPKNFEQYNVEITTTFDPAEIGNPLAGPRFGEFYQAWLRYTEPSDSSKYDVRMY